MKDTRILVRRDLFDLDRLAAVVGAGLVLEELRDPVATPVMDDYLLASTHSCLSWAFVQMSGMGSSNGTLLFCFSSALFVWVGSSWRGVVD